MENNTNQQVQQSQNDQTKIYRVLSYIGILWIIGLLVEDKNEPDVKFHTGQGIILTIASAIAGAVLGVLCFILGVVSGLLDNALISILTSVFTSLLSMAVSGGKLALMIVGIINAVNNQNKELPVIGKFAFYK